MTHNNLNEMIKCSRCRKTRVLLEFGVKKNGLLYKTCMACRKVPPSSEPTDSETSSTATKPTCPDIQRPA